MKKLILFFFFLSKFCFAQKRIVVDKDTKLPISFVTVNYKNGGTYSDEKGFFNYYDNSEILLTHIGYEDLLIKADEINDTIFLIPKVNALNEVKIVSKINHRLKIDFSKNASVLGSFPMNNEAELITELYPKGKSVNAQLKNVYIKSEKNIVKYLREEKKVNFVVRLNIYEIENDTIGSLIYSTALEKVNPFFSKTLIFNIENENIRIPKEGIALGLENMGVVDEMGVFVKKSYNLRPVMTDKINDYYNQKTSLRSAFTKEKFIDFMQLDGKSVTRNLSLGLDLLLE